MRRLAFLLVVAAGLTAPATASAVEPTVSVTATVEREVPNDTAAVHFAVSKERPGRAAALRIVALRAKGVIAASQRVAGVGPGDVTTGSISVRRVKRGKRPVYRASEGVAVITHQPQEAGVLIAAGVAAGATSTQGPSFFVGDRAAAYDAALVEAFEEAKVKAEKLATAAGATLGPALTITEDGAVAAAREFKGTSASPVGECGSATVHKRAGGRNGRLASGCTTPPPVKPGKSTVTASVDATFALQ
jgi:uncharacterized protein